MRILRGSQLARHHMGQGSHGGVPTEAVAAGHESELRVALLPAATADQGARDDDEEEGDEEGGPGKPGLTVAGHPCGDEEASRQLLPSQHRELRRYLAEEQRQVGRWC